LSRVTDFDDTYAESRDRLLLQLYAYCGDADAADDALNEAFITASRHWQRLKAPETLHPWLRERAVRRLDGRLRTQPHAGARQPSRQNARLLATLGKLDPTSRQGKLGDGQSAIVTDTVGFIHKPARSVSPPVRPSSRSPARPRRCTATGSTPLPLRSAPV